MLSVVKGAAASCNSAMSAPRRCSLTALAASTGVPIPGPEVASVVRSADGVAGSADEEREDGDPDTATNPTGKPDYPYRE